MLRACGWPTPTVKAVIEKLFLRHTYNVIDPNAAETKKKVGKQTSTQKQTNNHIELSKV